MASSPTQRSLALMREQGYVADIAESYNAFIKKRKDLYKFIDLVGLHPKHKGVLAVQTTSGSNIQARVKKAEGLPAYHLWLACGNPVEFHGWRKLLKKKGGKQKIWVPKVIRVTQSILN